MEQGDHVVKSPWSNWQFGVNGFSSNWGGTFKGRGDKSENILMKESMKEVTIYLREMFRH